MPAYALHEPVLVWYAENARTSCRGGNPAAAPWGVLVSEVMLQQTPVVRVQPVWKDLDGTLADPPGPGRRGAAGGGHPALGPAGLPAAGAAPARGGRRDRRPARRRCPRRPRPAARPAGDRRVHGRGHHVVRLPATPARSSIRTCVGYWPEPLRAPGLPRHRPHRSRGPLVAGLVPDDAETAGYLGGRLDGARRLVCAARAPRCPDCPVPRVCRWQLDGAPPYTGRPRRGQAYAGTDRYVRGLLLAVLREAHGSVPLVALVAGAPDDVLRDPGQRDRCLDALVSDGLVEPLERSAVPAAGLTPRDSSTPP